MGPGKEIGHSALEAGKHRVMADMATVSSTKSYSGRGEAAVLILRQSQEA